MRTAYGALRKSHQSEGLAGARYGALETSPAGPPPRGLRQVIERWSVRRPAPEPVIIRSWSVR